MKKTAFLWLIALAGVFILAVLLIRPPAWATPSATHLPSEQQMQADVASPQLAADADQASSRAPHSTLQADTPSSDNCIACHTDKKKLKAVAEEPEEVKSEQASGEG